MWLLIFLIILIIWFAWDNQAKNGKFDQICADAQFLKKTASAVGGFYRSSYSSREDFLDFMGQFFKYKKHEWVFVAFMKNGVVDMFWVNKGPDNESVSPFIGLPCIAEICRSNGFNRVVVGHNHPAGVLAPSRQDRIFFEAFLDSLADVNVSVEHLVFVAGAWRNYGLSIGQHFRRFFHSPNRV